MSSWSAAPEKKPGLSRMRRPGAFTRISPSSAPEPPCASVKERGERREQWSGSRLGSASMSWARSSTPRLESTDSLWGRSGRQGAFGASRSILSLEDRIIAHGGGVPKAAARPSEPDDSGRTFYEGPAMTGPPQHAPGESCRGRRSEPPSGPGV